MKRQESRFVFLAIFAASILFAIPQPPDLHAQSPANVLLVINEASPISVETGNYYAERRKIPPGNVLRVRTQPGESISRGDFDRQIVAPIRTWLNQSSAQDRILYIVLTKGIPLRIDGTYGMSGTSASVDSELALLYRRMSGAQVPNEGRIPNPYFLGDLPLEDRRPFTHEAWDIYLVTRLDGFNSRDIRGLIDRGLAPESKGKILLDAKEPMEDAGNQWLQSAERQLKAMGHEDTVLESTYVGLNGISGVLGYFSWGSNDPAVRKRDLKLGFVPGALAAMFLSSDARTFTEPPETWEIGTWQDPTSHYAGSPQNLTGDLIRAGVTGTAGNVSEPLLDATIRPDILFPAYLSGFSLAESFYLATPFLSWQTVVVGDPLCAPFRTRLLAREEIDGGIDPETELPGFFSAWKHENFVLPASRTFGMQPEIGRLLVRAEVRLNKRDWAGARKALEEVTAKDDRITSAHLMLSSIYEMEGLHDLATERYRKILRLDPGNVIALNNLAYATAVRGNAPAEALSMAERAYELAPADANVAHTLGWIHHLLGNHEKAVAILEDAERSAPQAAEIQLHLAIAYAAAARPGAAAAALSRAVTLSPELERREEVRKLRELLKP